VDDALENSAKEKTTIISTLEKKTTAEEITKEGNKKPMKEQESILDSDDKPGEMPVGTKDNEASDEMNTQAVKSLCVDDHTFKYKDVDGFNCEYIRENKPDKCDKLYYGEKVGVVSCPVSCNMVAECMALQQEKETSVAEGEIEGEGSDSVDGKTGPIANYDAQSEKQNQVTIVPTKTVDEDDHDAKDEQNFDDQQLEKEIETKLEQALEGGELDEEEVMKFEDEMKEALEEGVGEIFEEELDKELRCNDDPDFLYMDGDQERDCLWIQQNKRCQHVHGDSGKVIGKFFCPETCEMKEECEKVTVTDTSLEAPEVEDATSGKEVEGLGAVPKAPKSMTDEIGIGKEFKNSSSNVYGSGNVDSVSGGDMFTYHNKGDSLASLGDDTFAYGDDEAEDVMYDNKYKSTENSNQWDNLGGSASQEYNEEPSSHLDYSQQNNGVDNWQGYGGENQQEGDNGGNTSVDYEENWLEEDGGFPFGWLILFFLGVGFFILRKSQSSSRRQQEVSRGGYQRVGRRVDVHEHSKRY
jgi:hypothetical protein